MHESERPTLHVALLIETSNAYARGLLAGIRDYLTENPHWSIYVSEHSRLETDSMRLDGWRGDGVIARIENRATVEVLQRVGLPVVDLSAGRLMPGVPGIETDDAEIVRLAIGHFAERGLRNFAFCGDPRFAWSRNRERHFGIMAAAQGQDCGTFQLRSSTGTDRAALGEWLGRLPKPVGVLACYDIAAQEVLEACRVGGVSAPEHVAVLGVDDDDLICALATPSLSSVAPDARQAGYVAATLLDAIMRGETPDASMRLIPPLRVVARQSTDLLGVDDPLVARAIRLIRDRSSGPVSVGELQRHVGLSRRALDVRFRRSIGRTTHSEIVRARMSRVADCLEATDWPLSRIADSLGFPHAEYMATAFKKFSGRTPTGYRLAVRRGR